MDSGEQARASRWTYADVVKLHVGRELKLVFRFVPRLDPQNVGNRKFVDCDHASVIRASKGGLVQQQRGGKGCKSNVQRKGVSQVGVSSWARGVENACAVAFHRDGPLLVSRPPHGF